MLGMPTPTGHLLSETLLSFGRPSRWIWMMHSLRLWWLIELLASDRSFYNVTFKVIDYNWLKAEYMKNPEEMDKTGDECWFNRYFSLMVKIPFETLLKMLNWLSSFLKKVPSNVISFKGTRQMSSGTFAQFSSSQRREWKWNLGDLGNYFRLFLLHFGPNLDIFTFLGNKLECYMIKQLPPLGMLVGQCVMKKWQRRFSSW